MVQIARRARRLSGLSLEDLAVPSGHVHIWSRLPGSVGLFACRDRACLWCGVCPGCLGSLHAAFQVQAGIPGMVLAWCTRHQEGSGDGD